MPSNILENRFAKISAGSSLLVVWLIFAYVVSWHIDLPGLYMDAVNPDFQVVDVLHGRNPASPMIYLPGNLIAGRIPLLTSMYHGTQNIWVDLPIVAIFGANLASLRAGQALFGIAILTALFFLLRTQTNSSLLLAWLPVATLALDPVFSYAFRTQLYITLGPVAWLLAAILATNRAFQSNSDSSQDYSENTRLRWLALAGFSYGAAVFGYFIYSFFFPVFLLAFIVSYLNFNKTSDEMRVSRVIVWTLFGFLLGISGYIVGYLRIMWKEHGLAGFLSFFSNYRHALGVFDTHLNPIETVHYFSNLVWRVFSNDWQHALMFDDAWPEPGSEMKIILLLILPMLILAWREIRRESSGRLKLIIGLLACFPAIALIFGNRLSGHHFVCLLPLAYTALATSLITIQNGNTAKSVTKYAVATIWLILISFNILGQYVTGKELLTTHGRHLFSDAINNFALDAKKNESEYNKQHYYFPDWGLYMPFHFLTNGEIRHSLDIDLNNIRSELCNGHDIRIALVYGDISRRFEDMASAISWAAAELQPYNDYEGHQVFVLGTFHGLPRDKSQNSDCLETAI